MAELHPYYRKHLPAMEEAMRERLDLAEPWLKEVVVSRMSRRKCMPV
jgi:hypothetical protein